MPWWRCQPFPSRIILQVWIQNYVKTEIPWSKRAAKMTAKSKSGGNPGAPKFPLAPPQLGSRRTQTGPVRRPPLPQAPAKPDTSRREGHFRWLSHPAPRPSLLRSLLQPTEGKGKGQCIPKRPSPPEASGANASSKIPPLRSSNFAFSRLLSLKSFPDSPCGRTLDASMAPIPSQWSN